MRRAQRGTARMRFWALPVSGQITPSLVDGQDTLDHTLTARLVGLVSLTQRPCASRARPAPISTYFVHGHSAIGSPTMAHGVNGR